MLAIVASACGGGGDDSSDGNGDTTTISATSTATVAATMAADIPTPTAAATPTLVPVATPTLIPSPTAAPTPTTAALPTPTATSVPTAVPTATMTPTATPTQGPPTPIPTATPIGYSEFSGTGFLDTEEFSSPPNLPWVIEWEAEGSGANSINVSLMDPLTKGEIIELVADSGTGQIGGINLVVGNIGTFFLRIDGPEAGWKIWIRQQ